MTVDERSSLLHVTGDSEPTNSSSLEDQRSPSSLSSGSNSRRSDSPPPYPWRPLLILQLLTAAQPLAFEIVFPFVNQMILEIGVVNDPEQVGFYSGIIESIFSLMSFLTSVSFQRLSTLFVWLTLMIQFYLLVIWRILLEENLLF